MFFRAQIFASREALPSREKDLSASISGCQLSKSPSMPGVTPAETPATQGVSPDVTPGAMADGNPGW